jgi:hypothetical protein
MEPPTKRMRFWQSVEVDEENAEYIKAKQKQQQKFKGRLESIFEKYGNMHESMSDEIDMKTNRVVVDRGHLRRLKRQVGRKESMLLDTLGLAMEKEPDQEDEEEENAQDSEDELAPTQPVKSKDGEPELDGQRTKVSDAQSLLSDNIPSVLQHTNAPAASIPQLSTTQTPNTPNPTPNLLPLIQFPQTPAGQQAQTTFYMTLTQGIGELVHKAMAQSGLLPPNFSTPFTNAAPPPTTPVTTTDKIAPATDPRWFFPPLTAATHQDTVVQSSPLPVHMAASAAEQVDQAVGTALPHEHQEQILAGLTPLPVSHVRLQESSPTRCRGTSPRVEVQRRRIRTAKKYHFTPDDDAYISKKKMVNHLSWVAIKNSQAKWKDWPASAISRRWSLIKDQNLHLQTPLQACSNDDSGIINHESDEQMQAPPTNSHHLPTPSTSEHEDDHNEVAKLAEAPKGFSSSVYFDDDERELLSLAGSDVEEDHHLPEDEDITDPTSEDSIIPSIEMSGFIDEDQLQQDLLESLPMRDAIITPTRQASVQVKTEPTSPSPIITQHEDTLTRRFETIPDSDMNDSDMNDSDMNDSDMNDDTMQQIDTASPLLCPICNRSFKTPQTLARHQANPRNTHTHPAPPRTRSISLNLIADAAANDNNDDNDDDDDDLLLLPPPPTTPLQIKREPSTSSASFFVSTMHTPKPAASSSYRASSSRVSGLLSASKIDRRAHVKQLKQCWKGAAAAATPSTPGSIGKAKAKAKRMSLGGLEQRKRAWVDEEGSEEWDELCL